MAADIIPSVRSPVVLMEAARPTMELVLVNTLRPAPVVTILARVLTIHRPAHSGVSHRTAPDVLRY